mgnify:CR=1 FL=1
MEKKAWLICICCLCCMCGVSAPKKNNFSVKRGVNISHWLSQSNVRGENRAVFFTEADVKFLSDLTICACLWMKNRCLRPMAVKKKKFFLCCIMLCRGVKNIG